MIDLTTLPRLPDHPEIARAIDYAREAHTGQVRKYTGEDYYHHPIEVARIFLALYPDADDLIPSLVAAILHDVVEDTPKTIEDIYRDFGPEVARIVCGLTDVSTPEIGNRAYRKSVDRAHTHSTCPRTKTIKCCDLISNTYSIVAHAPGFAKIYLAEKKLLLAGMTEAHPACHATAVAIMEAGFEELEMTDA